MPIIQNFDSLATNPQRQVVLQVIDAALQAVQPKEIMTNHFFKEGDTLHVQGKQFDLSSYERVSVIGFGKGSAGIAQIVEKTLGEKLTEGYVIDTVQQQFTKIHFTLGTHPLPSEQNSVFTKTVLENIHDLTEKDLVLVIICGGGSALFETASVDLPTLTAINNELLKSGATISEMNVIRKHLSLVKGGGLAKHLFPAHIVSLIFSDVPGNDLSVIASGPTVKDPTTLADVKHVYDMYHLTAVPFSQSIFHETPQEDKYFIHVSNIIMVSNQTALKAMQQKAKELGIKATILTDRLQGDAKKLGKVLLSETKKGEMLLVGGETTVHVNGNGRGGRNQTLILAALPFIEDMDVIASVGTDGWDFTTFAGALGDKQTVEKTKEQGLDIKAFLDNDNSTAFFEQVGDGILTGRLESNVSDIMLTYKP